METMMKTIADAMFAVYASGMAAAAMVAMKYYVAKMMESMTSVGYADDP